MHRNKALDGLRGIAAVGVAFCHIHPDGTFWMWSFVDLFLVLSGYLITTILLRLQSWDLRSLKNFFMRRVIRIWPVYYLTYAAVIALWLVWQHRHGEPASLFAGAKESSVFLQYIVGDYAHLPRGVNYLWWFGHSWSIAVEEQFYVVWPLLLYLFRRRLLQCVIVLLGLLGVVFCARILTDWPPYVLATRADGLILGGLLAVVTAGVQRGLVPARLVALGRWLPVVGIVAGSALVAPYIYAGYTGDPQNLGGQIGLSFSFALFHASMVALLVGGRLPQLDRVLSVRPLVYIGSLSYAIYMFHVPTQKVLDQFYNEGILRPRWLVELIFWVIVIGLAAISRVVLEDRMERLKSRFPLQFKAPNER